MYAQVAELVDAPASGAGILTGVEVRVFSWAPKHQNPLQLDCKGFLLVCKGFRQPLRFLYQYSLSCRLLPVNPLHLRRQVPVQNSVLILQSRHYQMSYAVFCKTEAVLQTGHQPAQVRRRPAI